MFKKFVRRKEEEEKRGEKKKEGEGEEGAKGGRREREELREREGLPCPLCMHEGFKVLHCRLAHSPRQWGFFL